MTFMKLRCSLTKLGCIPRHGSHGDRDQSDSYQVYRDLQKRFSGLSLSTPSPSFVFPQKDIVADIGLVAEMMPLLAWIPATRSLSERPLHSSLIRCLGAHPHSPALLT